MKTYLGFSVLEYSIVFGAAIILGAAVNLYLTRLSAFDVYSCSRSGENREE